MKNLIEKKYIDIAFRISLILKGLNAVLEIIGGFVIIFLTQDFTIRIVSTITQNELAEDPRDLISNYLLASAHNFSIGTQTFVSIYLLTHGIIKLLLIAGLLRKKLWAYPTSLVVFCLFIVYQIYRFIYTQSLWLIVLTAFDLFIIWLVWREYQYMVRDKMAS